MRHFIMGFVLTIVVLMIYKALPGLPPFECDGCPPPTVRLK